MGSFIKGFLPFLSLQGPLLYQFKFDCYYSHLFSYIGLQFYNKILKRLLPKNKTTKIGNTLLISEA